MFGIGTPEILGIALIVLMIYGPDRLPHVLKNIIQTFRKIKTYTDDVSYTVTREIHQLENSIQLKEETKLIQNTIQEVKETVEKIDEPN